MFIKLQKFGLWDAHAPKTWPRDFGLWGFCVLTVVQESI